MSKQSIGLNKQLYHYLVSVSLRDQDVLHRLREETAKQKSAVMQIAPDQGQFMAMLIKLLGARRTLEVGVFTGYSSLCVALALPDDGQIIACDVNEEWTNIACRYWQDAGVAHKIDLRLAPAMDTLAKLVREGEHNRFDFAFIDADKTNYNGYYELCLQLIRPGGLIAIDNVLWGGAVAKRFQWDVETKAIRALNAKIHADQRVDISLIPVGDGLMLARKRGLGI
ncbi:MAG: SAM-dependent methyltransferase [Chloroflexi bacterium AL-N1]|nr:SAM-dependent methyltransferase [Chloroflexi bacterium AL-N1]NOK77288.1 SAM-dependent methyltransferase [Chloroflexi bacterium AL-N5]